MKVEMNVEISAVSYLPENSSFDSVPIDIDGVILCSDEAVLYQSVLERVDSVPISPPGEDLDPSHFSLLLRPM